MPGRVTRARRSFRRVMSSPTRPGARRPARWDFVPFASAPGCSARPWLAGILARPIQQLTILDPDIPGDLSTDKEIILDIRAQLTDGSRVDIEMQIRTTSALASRLLYYGARDYADQLGRGDQYHLLTPTIVIVWLVEPLFPTLDRLHSIFELRERHTHTLFGDQLAIHTLQLHYLSPSSATGDTAQVERWARFLVAKDDAELRQLASKDPIMTTAKETLDQLSQDPVAHRLARRRADAVKLNKLDLLATRVEAEARGKARGKAEGKAEVLLKLLQLRFGSLPEPTRARVHAATSEQLDTWALRVLRRNPRRSTRAIAPSSPPHRPLRPQAHPRVASSITGHPAHSRSAVVSSDPRTGPRSQKGSPLTRRRRL